MARSSGSMLHELGAEPVTRQMPSVLKTSSALRSGTSARMGSLDEPMSW